MYYDVKKGHGLPHDPFKAIVAPRPIGWISTISKGGIANLAPYSFFNAVCAAPPMVMFSSDGYKDSVKNIEGSYEFVCNFVSDNLLHEMSATSVAAPYEEDEFQIAGLDTAPSKQIKPPRVARAYAALECVATQIIRLDDIEGNATNSWLTIGQVVGVHIDDSVLIDGHFDLKKAKPVARLGYKDYAIIDTLFELNRPS